MTNVLLAVDGLLYGKVIVDFVVNHQWAPETHFRLLHAIEPPRGADAWPEIRQTDEEAMAAKTMLAEMASRVERSLPHCKVTYDVCLDYPKEAILSAANDWPAQMIVMGSHGRSALQCFLLGSVSLSVMLHATCSTIVVRISQEVLQKEQEKERAQKAKVYEKIAG